MFTLSCIAVEPMSKADSAVAPTPVFSGTQQQRRAQMRQHAQQQADAAAAARRSAARAAAETEDGNRNRQLSDHSEADISKFVSRQRVKAEHRQFLQQRR